jgi:uncharacterized protein (DUF2147 family)
MKKVNIIAFILGIVLTLKAQNKDQDAILGKWMNAEKDLAVEIFKLNGAYRAKVIWFECYDGTKMSDYFDKKNPNKALQNRPWLGLEVLSSLSFKGGTEWQNGHIYDPNTGNTFRSVCHLEKDNILKVRGYWMYQWIGKNLIFNRMSVN